MNETELWNWIMDGKSLYERRTATATLTKDLYCPAFECFQEINWPKGTKVKITMASRFGDVGLSDDLTATSYKVRVQCGVPHDAAVVLLPPEGYLENIQIDPIIPDPDGLLEASRTELAEDSE
jgi:hypothetical protein